MPSIDAQLSLTAFYASRGGVFVEVDGEINGILSILCARLAAFIRDQQQNHTFIDDLQSQCTFSYFKFSIRLPDWRAAAAHARFDSSMPRWRSQVFVRMSLLPIVARAWAIKPLQAHMDSWQ